MVKEKMENKYLNEAIIGNKNMIATFTSKGELQRLYFPSKDNKQYINFFHTGVKINNSDLIYLQDDINNVYKQYYDTDTNVLNTEITNTYFNLKIVQTDFIMIKENVLVKKYIFLNDGKIDLDTKFYIHSELLSDQNNQVGCKIVDGGMMQYAHDFSVSTFAKEHKLCSHQINGSKETIKRGEIQDKDYIGMSKDSSISYDLGIIKPQEKKILEICILIDENRNLSDMEDEIDRVTKIDLDKEYTSTKSYWRKYVKAHNSLGLKEAKNSYEERILEIYKRSILLFPLLANQETGGIIASPEIDENFTKCGRYAYCWPRDAVFITKAMDILNMEKETEKFYKVFCKKTQSKNGMWEQRFYTDGKLAPCWGYQIDETASVVYGVYEHYKYTKSEKFLKDNLKMCEKAIDFLKKYLKDVDSVIVGISAGSINSAGDVYNSPESDEDLNNSPYLKGLGLTTINIEPHFILENLNDDYNKKLQRNAIIKESYNRTIIALTDGAYILQTNNECKLYGESYKIKNGIIDKICDNDECVILNDSL